MNLKTFVAVAALSSGIASSASAADIDKTHPGATLPYARAACSSGGPVRAWTVHPDEDLQTVLLEWSKRAGWHLQWQSDYNFTIGGSATFRAPFTAAVGSLMSGMQEARPSPVAEVYPENCVLIITDGLSAVR